MFLQQQKVAFRAKIFFTFNFSRAAKTLLVCLDIHRNCLGNPRRPTIDVFKIIKLDRSSQINLQKKEDIFFNWSIKFMFRLATRLFLQPYNWNQLLKFISCVSSVKTHTTTDHVYIQHWNYQKTTLGPKPQRHTNLASITIYFVCL